MHGPLTWNRSVHRPVRCPARKRPGPERRKRPPTCGRLLPAAKGPSARSRLRHCHYHGRSSFHRFCRYFAAQTKNPNHRNRRLCSRTHWLGRLEPRLALGPTYPAYRLADFAQPRYFPGCLVLPQNCSPCQALPSYPFDTPTELRVRPIHKRIRIRPFLH